jgi:serine/threonine kinase 38
MKERAENAKAFIESRYNKLKNDEKERKEAWDMLENKMMRLNLSEQERELIKQDIMHKEAELNRRM